MAFFWLTAGALLASVKIVELSQGTASHRGTRFVLVFQSNRGSNATNTLYITSSLTNDVSVSVTYEGEVRESLVVSMTSAGIVTLPASLRISGTTTTDSKTIVVTSSEPVSVWAQNYCKSSVGTALIFPVDHLGRSYVAVTQTPYNRAQVAVVAVEDNTTVLVETTEDPPVSHTVLLKDLEAFQVDSTQDLTGTTIRADKPVAVFSGNQKSGHRPTTWYDNLFEQLAPMDDWGDYFITVPTNDAATNETDTYVIVARESGTTVTISGHAQFILEAPPAWQEVKLPATSLYVINSDLPVMAVKIVTVVKTHPCMAQLVPRSQWLSSYEFVTTVRQRSQTSTEIWIQGAPHVLSDVTINGQNFTSGSDTVCSEFVIDSGGQEIQACFLQLGPQEMVHLMTQTGVAFAAHALVTGINGASCFALGRKFPSVSIESDASIVALPSSTGLEEETVDVAILSMTQRVISSQSPDQASVTTAASSMEPLSLWMQTYSRDDVKSTPRFELSTSFWTDVTPELFTSSWADVTPELSTSSWIEVTSELSTSYWADVTSILAEPYHETALLTESPLRVLDDVSSTVVQVSDAGDSSLPHETLLARSTPLTQQDSSAESETWTSNPVAADSAVKTSFSGGDSFHHETFMTSSPSVQGVDNAGSTPSAFSPGTASATVQRSEPHSLSLLPSTGVMSQSLSSRPSTSGSSVTEFSTAPNVSGVTVSPSSLPTHTGSHLTSPRSWTSVTAGARVEVTVTRLYAPEKLLSTEIPAAKLAPDKPNASKICACKHRCLRTKAIKDAPPLRSAVARMQSELVVNTRNTSVSRRKRTSAPDDRATSQVAGVVGIVMVVIIVFGFMISDIPLIVRTFKGAMKEIKK